MMAKAAVAVLEAVDEIKAEGQSGRYRIRGKMTPSKGK
jgi:hypothetical protein